MRAAEYAWGADILDALMPEAPKNVTRAVLVIRAGHIPQLHVWFDLLDPSVRPGDLRSIRHDFDLVLRDRS